MWYYLITLVPKAKRTRHSDLSSKRSIPFTIVCYGFYNNLIWSHTTNNNRHGICFDLTSMNNRLHEDNYYPPQCDFRIFLDHALHASSDQLVPQPLNAAYPDMTSFLTETAGADRQYCRDYSNAQILNIWLISVN